MGIEVDRLIGLRRYARIEALQWWLTGRFPEGRRTRLDLLVGRAVLLIHRIAVVAAPERLWGRLASWRHSIETKIVFEVIIYSGVCQEPDCAI